MEEGAGSRPAAAALPCCGFCQAREAPYTCPRCHLRYCSVPCYRRHGSCAGHFQSREWELQLRGQRGDAASRRRLEGALARLRRLREPGDAEAALGLDLSSSLEEAEEELWEQLSPEQRKAFDSLLSSGEISALLPTWEPWWAGARRHGATLVEELGPAQSEAHQAPGQPEKAPQPSKQGPQKPPRPSPASNPVPRVAATIPPLAALSRIPVSPLLRCQLPNVLFAYAYALALYNGDVDQEDGALLLPEFCGTVLDVSGALGAKQTFPSVAEALQAALQALAAGRYPACPLGHAGVMVAVAQILMGECQAKQKAFTLAALSHLARLLRRGKRHVPAAEDRARIYGAQKKCEFLLSWVNENQGQLTLLALEVQQECQAHQKAVKEVGAITQELERMWGGKVPPPSKPLIEELD